MKKLTKKKIISLTKITQPFLMVDSIMKIKSLNSATGLKKVTKNSWFFKCHFIDQPMMPGTLIQESMLQTIIATLVDKPAILKIDIKILKIRKSIIETFVVVSNNKNIKIATGNFKHFISSK